MNRTIKTADAAETYFAAAEVSCNESQKKWSSPAKVEVRKVSPKQFLLSYPNGAYTCARTSGKQVFGESFHRKRLQQSFELLYEGNLVACQLFTEQVPIEDQFSVKLVTVLAFCYGMDGTQNNVHVVGHVMHPAPKDTLRASFALVTSMQTQNGNRIGNSKWFAKCSAWISERKSLENMKSFPHAGAVEVLMCTPDGNELLEGLVTNVFVVIGKEVMTSNDKVLYGQMRGLVIEACRKLGIKVVLKPPRLEDISKWEEVFLTSITKPVCILERIHHHDSCTEYKLGDSLSKHIQSEILKLL